MFFLNIKIFIENIISNLTIYPTSPIKNSRVRRKSSNAQGNRIMIKMYFYIYLNAKMQFLVG